MANEGSAEMVFEHPLQSEGRMISMAPQYDRKNPGNLADLSVEAGLGGQRTNDHSRKNPPAVNGSTGSSQYAAAPGTSHTAPDAQTSAAQDRANTFAGQASAAVMKASGTIVTHVRANPYSVSLLSFVGGVCLAVSSIMHLLIVSNIVDPLPYILRIYELCFGVLLMVIDGPGERFPQHLREKALRLAPFSETDTNRILFYLFIACLQGSLGTWWNTVTGWYFAMVAVFFGVVKMATPPQNAAEHGVALASTAS